MDLLYGRYIDDLKKWNQALVELKNYAPDSGMAEKIHHMNIEKIQRERDVIYSDVEALYMDMESEIMDYILHEYKYRKVDSVIGLCRDVNNQALRFNMKKDSTQKEILQCYSDFQLQFQKKSSLNLRRLNYLSPSPDDIMDVKPGENLDFLRVTDDPETFKTYFKTYKGIVANLQYLIEDAIPQWYYNAFQTIYSEGIPDIGDMDEIGWDGIKKEKIKCNIIDDEKVVEEFADLEDVKDTDILRMECIFSIQANVDKEDGINTFSKVIDILNQKKEFRYYDY